SFIAACQNGDLQTLTDLLAQDVTVWSDGGGKVTAAVRPIHGRDFVVRFLLGVLSKIPEGFHTTVKEVNGRTAILSWVGKRLFDVVTLEIADGKIQALRIILNPEKLTFIHDQLRHINHEEDPGF